MRNSIVTVLAVAALTSGCATVLKSKHSDVAVSSRSPGAEILVNGTAAGVTPATLKLSNKASHVITVRADGKEESCQLKSSASVGWIVLDVATAGGWLVDLITKNWNKLDRTTCAVSI
jgi:hypothetical protein